MNEPTILLVNPWIYDFAAYDLWVKPVGLLSIAGLLKKIGFRVHMIDCLDPHHPAMTRDRFSRQPKRKLTDRGHFHKQELPKPRQLLQVNKKYRRYGILPSVLEAELRNSPAPSAILVTSMMTYWYPAVVETINTIKRIYPRVPVVLGGIYATLCPEHARRYAGAHYVFTGPCNEDLLTLLNDLTGHQNNGCNEHFFPKPDCSLLSSKKSIPLLTSRGCPFSCTYCASNILYPSFEQRDPRTIVSEIEHWIYEEETTDFVFFDDALLVNPENHILPFLNEIIRRNIHVRFHVPNGLHVRAIDHTLSELLFRAGFKTLRLGLESADPEIQITTGNKVRNRDFVRAAQALLDVGFSSHEVGVYVLVGLPGQEFRSAYESVCFVLDNGLRPFVSEYSPIPGTALWNSAVRSSPFPIADEPLFHNNTLLPCRWEKFTVRDLIKLKAISRKCADVKHHI